MAPEAEKSASWLKYVLCRVNFSAQWQFVCSGFGAGQGRGLGADLHPGLFLVSAHKKCWATHSWIWFSTNSAHEGWSGITIRNYRWFRRFLLRGDELCLWHPCNPKYHHCFHCTETHPWTPKCHQTEIIYNSTSLCPPPPTSITVCVVMNTLILPFFIKSVVSEINVLHLQLLNLPCLGQPLE